MKFLDVFFSIMIILFVIIFFLMFFYYLFNQKSKLIKYRVIKDPIYTDIKYDKLQNKYNKVKCNDKCTQKFCDEYESQVIKYDLCRECKKEFKCYDPYNKKCMPCKNYNTCEELYGCHNKPPINPIKNFCTRCWIL